MHLAVYLPLLVPVMAALFAERLSRILDPRVATWLLAGSAVVLSGAAVTVLALLAIAGLIQIPAIARLVELSPQILRRDDPPSTIVALFAAVGLSAAMVAVTRKARRRIKGLLAASTQARSLPGDEEIVVVEDDSIAEAFALPGRPGRIVVSTGMLAALTDRQREVLLAHERAHLRLNHHWFTAAAQLAASTNPLLRPLAKAIAFTVERWADEEAARSCGDRRLVARTIARAAMAKAALPAPSAPHVAFGVAGDPATIADLSAAGPVPRRAAALLTEPLRRRPIPVACVALVLAATGVCVLEAITDLHELIELAARGS
jgi:Zn-dependent protease with chaperone function